jgi:hypothetical protein
MEYRDNGLMVDYSGQRFLRTNELPPAGVRSVVVEDKSEREQHSEDQEIRLMRAMKEIREYTPKSMNTAERQMFDSMCENIFRKHGITPESYRQQFGHLGTTDQLHR